MTDEEYTASLTTLDLLLISRSTFPFYTHDEDENDDYRNNNNSSAA